MSTLIVMALAVIFVGFLLAVVIGRNATRSGRRSVSMGDSSFVMWSDGGGSGSDCSPGDAGCGDGGGGGGDGGGGD